MPSRRTFLATVGSTALAGCLANPASPNGTESTSTGTATPTDLSGSWTHPDADARATKAAAVPAPDVAPEAAWSTDLGRGASPTLLSGNALFTAVGGQLTRRDARTGEVAWQTSFDRVDLGAVVGDTLYVTTGESPRLRALSVDGPGDGFERWTVEGVRAERATGDVVVGTGPETLRAFDPDGTERWRVTTDDLDVSAARFGSVAVGPSHVFAAAENSGSVAWVYGFDRATGEARWHHEGPNHAGMLTVTPEFVLSGGFYGSVEAWRHDGTVAWKVETTPPVGGLAFADGRVYVSANAQGSEDEPAFAVLNMDGETLWTRKQGATAALTTDAALVDTGGQLAALDPKSGGERWRWTHEDAIGYVVPADGGLLVQTGTDENRKTLHLLV